MRLHQRDVTEQVTAPDEQNDPGDTPGQVIGEEARERHAGDAGHERCTGADDGHEARQQDRHAAVAAEEPFRVPQVLDLQQPVTAAEGRRPDGAPHRVIHRVAEHGCHGEQTAQQRRVERAARIHRRECTEREQQRVPGQKRRHDESGLREDHGEQDRVDPKVEAREQLDQVAVEMQDEVDEPRQHGAGGYPVKRAAVRGRRCECYGTSARLTSIVPARPSRAWLLSASSPTRTSASRTVRGGEPLTISSSAGASPAPPSRMSGTMPLPWIEAPEGVKYREVVSLTAPPWLSGMTVCTEPLP